MITGNGKKNAINIAFDERTDIWLWLHMRDQTGTAFYQNLPGNIIKQEIVNFGASPNGYQLKQNISQYLLPQERLKWISKDKRQICWLLNYLRRELNCSIWQPPAWLLERDLIIACLDFWDIDLTKKDKAVGRIEWAWNEHQKSDRIFKWFKGEEETARCGFAWDWLLRNRPNFTVGQPPISDQEGILLFFDGLWLSESDKKLGVIEIKNSWSQQKSRGKSSGKKQRNFVLSDTAIVALKELSSEYGIREAKIVETLIQLEKIRKVYLSKENESDSLNKLLIDGKDKH
ncbi:hypothetical protein [Pseudomonas sp.]|uniref:hypothetical protein n=1 Tax=Pseudomonas sp. TaxID=306 RepID=UPI0026180EC8|nr:hypothetical protein [Pseudomonas sp.]